MLILTATKIIHGDFHAKQVLLTADGKPSMLDLDDVLLGDPLEDLASFAAHLLRDAAVGAMSRQAAELHIEALVGSYTAAGQEVDRRALTANMILALVQMASYPFRTRHPDWPAIIGQILDAVVQWLEQ